MLLLDWRSPPALSTSLGTRRLQSVAIVRRGVNESTYESPDDVVKEAAVAGGVKTAVPFASFLPAATADAPAAGEVGAAADDDDERRQSFHRAIVRHGASIRGLSSFSGGRGLFADIPPCEGRARLNRVAMLLGRAFAQAACIWLCAIVHGPPSGSRSVQMC